MDCKEACRCMASFLDGTYPVKKEAPLLMHYRNCESCRKELAVSLSLNKAIEALENEEDSLDFINEDPMEDVNRLLNEEAGKYIVQRRFEADKIGFQVITGWALLIALGLQILYWKSTGFLFFG